MTGARDPPAHVITKPVGNVKEVTLPLAAAIQVRSRRRTRLKTA